MCTCTRLLLSISRSLHRSNTIQFVFHSYRPQGDEWPRAFAPKHNTTWLYHPPPTCIPKLKSISWKSFSKFSSHPSSLSNIVVDTNVVCKIAGLSIASRADGLGKLIQNSDLSIDRPPSSNPWRRTQASWKLITLRFVDRGTPLHTLRLAASIDIELACITLQPEGWRDAHHKSVVGRKEEKNCELRSFLAAMLGTDTNASPN